MRVSAFIPVEEAFHIDRITNLQLLALGHLAQGAALGGVIGGKLADKEVAGLALVQLLQPGNIAALAVIHQGCAADRLLDAGGAGALGNHIHKGPAPGRKALGDRGTQEDELLAGQGAVGRLFGGAAAVVAGVQEAQQLENKQQGDYHTMKL